MAPPSAEERYLTRVFFKLRIYQNKGDEFQSFFEKIMNYRTSEFESIAPYGREGDRKNDGYERDSGTYYQVYAPNNPDQHRTILNAATKATEDFAGLVKHWSQLSDVNHYRFVFNDAFLGVPAPVEAALLKIENDHEVSAKAITASRLEEYTFELEHDQILDVINGFIRPVTSFDTIEFGVLRDVIQHTLASRQPIDLESLLSVPNFDEKIEFNGLSKPVASLLVSGSFQHEAIDDYFSQDTGFAKQDLRDHLATLYEEVKHELEGADCPEHSDLVLFRLIDRMIPQSTQTGQHDAQSAAFVVLSYFFESCDVFEAPDATS